MRPGTWELKTARDERWGHPRQRAGHEDPFAPHRHAGAARVRRAGARPPGFATGQPTPTGVRVAVHSRPSRDRVSGVGSPSPSAQPIAS